MSYEVLGPPPRHLPLRRTAVIRQGFGNYEVWGQEGGQPEELTFDIHIGTVCYASVAHQLAQAWREDKERRESWF